VWSFFLLLVLSTDGIGIVAVLAALWIVLKVWEIRTQ
jgi:hypothetical protein